MKRLPIVVVLVAILTMGALWDVNKPDPLTLEEATAQVQADWGRAKALGYTVEQFRGLSADSALAVGILTEATRCHRFNCIDEIGGVCCFSPYDCHAHCVRWTEDADSQCQRVELE